MRDFFLGSVVGMGADGAPDPLPCFGDGDLLGGAGEAGADGDEVGDAGGAGAGEDGGAFFALEVVEVAVGIDEHLGLDLG